MKGTPQATYRFEGHAKHRAPVLRYLFALAAAKMDCVYKSTLSIFVSNLVS
jgi:hypothetical protein